MSDEVPEDTSYKPRPPRRDFHAGRLTAIASAVGSAALGVVFVKIDLGFGEAIAVSVACLLILGESDRRSFENSRGGTRSSATSLRHVWY